MKCALCENKECFKGKDCTNSREEEVALYKDENLKMLQVTGEMNKNAGRLDELIEFGKLMNYKKIGVAFCIAFKREAKVIHEILSEHFEVSSICCRNAGMDKSEFNMAKRDEKKGETSCNPIGQAHKLNERNTELNVLVGLCMGHDVLFNKWSEAPTTTLLVKDRKYRHNPLEGIVG
jgi:uncharacterized metal-binding protein